MEQIRKELEELSKIEMEEFAEKFFKNFQKAWNGNTEKIIIVYIDSFEYEEDFEKVKTAIGYEKTMELLKEHQIFDESELYIFYQGGDYEILTYRYDYEIVNFILDWIQNYITGRSDNIDEFKDELEWIRSIVKDTLKIFE